MPGAGDLDELISIERQTRTGDGGGGATVSWAEVTKMWARAQWLRGGEGERQGAVRELAVYRFTVLSEAVTSAALTTSDRVVWNGEFYNIRERPRRQADQPFTDIIAETGVAQ